jgi:hypothetical protein
MYNVGNYCKEIECRYWNYKVGNYWMFKVTTGITKEVTTGFTGSVLMDV